MILEQAKLNGDEITEFLEGDHVEEIYEIVGECVEDASVEGEDDTEIVDEIMDAIEVLEEAAEEA